MFVFWRVGEWERETGTEDNQHLQLLAKPQEPHARTYVRTYTSRELPTASQPKLFYVLTYVRTYVNVPQCRRTWTGTFPQFCAHFGNYFRNCAFAILRRLCAKRLRNCGSFFFDSYCIWSSYADYICPACYFESTGYPLIDRTQTTEKFSSLVIGCYEWWFTGYAKFCLWQYLKLPSQTTFCTWSAYKTNVSCFQLVLSCW